MTILHGEHDVVTEQVMLALSERIETQLGLYYPRHRWSDLRRGIRASLEEMEFADESVCLHELASSVWMPRWAPILARHLTIGETYFWRELKALSALEEHVLPPLIERRRAEGRILHLWSAGCCTGEEPYSLAILLHKMIPDIDQWDIHIRATDINGRFLERAATGIYRPWSFRGTPEWVKEQGFQRTLDGDMHILPHIKRRVQFSQFNLATDEYSKAAANQATGGVDIILCRNVLIYFSPEGIGEVVSKFASALRPDGWLLVSGTEASFVKSPQLSMVYFPDAILFQKTHVAPAKNEEPARRTPTLELRSRCNPLALKAGRPPKDNGTRARRAAPDRLTALDPLTQPRRPRHAKSGAAHGATPARTTPLAAPQFSGQAETAASLHERLVALYRRGQYGQVIAILEGGSASPVEPQLRLLLARCYANTGKLQLALEQCDAILADDRLVASAHYLRATILQEHGSQSEAEQALKHALFLAPTLVLAHFALGQLLWRSERRSEATRHFANARQLMREYRPDDSLPESNEITAAQLDATIGTLLQEASR
jgi:chemotaxis protein methyltransferase CheR